MSKKTIYILLTVLSCSLALLLYLEFSYFGALYRIRRENFDEATGRALSRAVRDLEISETKQALSPAARAELDALDDSARVRETLAILYRPADKPLAKRLDYNSLDGAIKSELSREGITLPYHFRITTSDGREVYRCRDFEQAGAQDTYRQELFPSDPRARTGVVWLHFPEMRRFIFNSVGFMIPAIVLTIIVCAMFGFTLWAVMRQRRLTEMKNDFINNMTHEFKTPVATISLAAQMLSDPSVEKKPDTVTHLSTVIADETKRLRFQVEKVLQMSILDRKAATYRKRELDIDRLAAEVASTFRLRVENVGGEITTNLDAEDMMVYADEMHLSGVLFNLLDNALKYRDPERAPHLEIATHVEGSKAVITVSDNGIGIKKENLKKIFDKFYRVHTGNLHDVKGFGLGLAYVKRVVTAHGGNITAESKAGQGTSFIITLPTTKK